MAREYDPRDSVPAGNGGRVCVPIRRNAQGIDVSIDPDGEIKSGMLKRGARQGEGFEPVKNLPEG